MKTWVARVYDTIVAGMEDAYFVPIRKKILSEASGVCLEIGAGTGNSIGAWPTGVTKLTLTEPCSNMRVQLLSKLKRRMTPGLLLIQSSLKFLTSQSEV